jgi:hypothetical protein
MVGLTLAARAVRERKDPLGAGGDGGFGLFRVDAPTLGQDVDKDRFADSPEDLPAMAAGRVVRLGRRIECGMGRGVERFHLLSNYGSARGQTRQFWSDVVGGFEQKISNIKASHRIESPQGA